MAAKRPILVYYPGGYVGHCSTVKRAIVRATQFLMDGPYLREYNRVNITEPNNPLQTVAYVCHTGASISVYWNRGGLEK